MEPSLLGQVLVLLALSVVAVMVLRRIHLPPILGYLLVGVVAGPHILGWLPDADTLHLLAEVGVVFLLFTIGMEFSVPQFMAMRGVVLGLGGLQVALSALGGWAVASAVGVPWQGAVVAGGALAMSSTAIVTKQLNEQLEMHARHGRLALGMLLFQDLAVVPFLVAIPILAVPDQAILSPLLTALAKGAAAFAALMLVGQKVLRPLFHVVAASHSLELFTLAVLLVALAAAWVTGALGLSLELGAFLAGMMLNETEYRHQIEAEIRPFRDVLLGLFFIYVGLQLDIGVLPQIWPQVSILLGAVVLGKGLLVVAITRLAGHDNGVALRTGMVLAQGGEFGFAVLALAIGYGLLTVQESQALIAAVVFSMALAPLLIRYNGAIAKRVCLRSYRRGLAQQAHALEEAARGLRGHVVLCGFGRIGQNLARFLTEEGFPYVAMDLDPMLVKEAWEAGEQVYYGDATHAQILRSAGLERARVLCVCFDDAHAAERVIRIARAHAARLPIIVRTRDDMDMERLETAGATEVVPETLEASMMLASHLLRRLDVPREEILHLVERSRAAHYEDLRGWFHGERPETLEAADDPHHLHTVVLQQGSWAVGRHLGGLGLAELGVRVVAVRRGAIRGEDPSPELMLRIGDAVVLMGPAEPLAHVEALLHKG